MEGFLKNKNSKRYLYRLIRHFSGANKLENYPLHQGFYLISLHLHGSTSWSKTNVPPPLYKRSLCFQFLVTVIIRYPPTHCWTSRQLNHSWPEKRGILETISLYLFPFAETTKRAGGLMTEETADVQKITKWPRANQSLLSPWTGRGAFPYLLHVSIKFLTFLFQLCTIYSHCQANQSTAWFLFYNQLLQCKSQMKYHFQTAFWWDTSMWITRVRANFSGLGFSLLLYFHKTITSTGVT